MMKWMIDKNSFPSILLLRRYLKIVMRYCESNDLLDLKLDEVQKQDLPFDLSILPHSFPPLPELTRLSLFAG